MEICSTIAGSCCKIFNCWTVLRYNNRVSKHSGHKTNKGQENQTTAYIFWASLLYYTIPSLGLIHLNTWFTCMAITLLGISSRCWRTWKCHERIRIRSSNVNSSISLPSVTTWTKKKTLIHAFPTGYRMKEKVLL